MSRYSVLCRDSEALCCVATKPGAHDKDALSRQTSYSGKKIKNKKKKERDPWDLGRHIMVLELRLINT